MTRGILEIVSGPMFAGKTSALLAKARSSKGETVLIKPSFDTRYGICEIKTHDGVSAEAFNLSNVTQILSDKAVDNAEIVLFDEIQFFTEPFSAATSSRASTRCWNGESTSLVAGWT